jgi:hypothetical protein
VHYPEHLSHLENIAKRLCHRQSLLAKGLDPSHDILRETTKRDPRRAAAV